MSNVANADDEEELLPPYTDELARQRFNVEDMHLMIRCVERCDSIHV